MTGQWPGGRRDGRMDAWRGEGEDRVGAELPTENRAAA